MQVINCKKALVVGASGGMGRTIAASLAKKGVQCALVGRSIKKLEMVLETCAQFKTSSFIIPCDISDPSEIKQCCETALKSLGGLNFLIHCAGDYNKASATECNLEIWDKILDANLRST